MRNLAFECRVRCLTSRAETTSSSTSEPTALSKSARKRLAKANRTASSAASSSIEAVKANIPSAEEVQEQAQETVQAASQKAESAVNGAKEILDNVVNETSQKVNGDVKPKIEQLVQNGTSAVTDTLKPNGSSSGATSPRAIGSSFVAPPSVPHVPSTNGERKSSFSQPPSTKFAPSLPKDLPEPAGNALPSNRKRSVPNDFTPSGKNQSGPASPSKLGLKLEEEGKKGIPAPESSKGVKFEDGIHPGQGKEGETVMAPKANRNVVERTVMTFVMIFGFIRTFATGGRGRLTGSATLRWPPVHDCPGASVSDIGLQGSHRAL